jgi:hypothetical protein
MTRKQFKNLDIGVQLFALLFCLSNYLIEGNISNLLYYYFFIGTLQVVSTILNSIFQPEITRVRKIYNIVTAAIIVFNLFVFFNYVFFHNGKGYVVEIGYAMLVIGATFSIWYLIITFLQPTQEIELDTEIEAQNEE